MRTVGFLLGFLFLTLAGPSYQTVAQTAPAPASSASETDSATGQTQANQPASSGSKKETEDSGSGEHRLHLRLGTIFLGAGYSRVSGPGYYPYDFYPLGAEYSAFWFPYWGPYPFLAPGYFGYGSAKGKVRLSAEPKTAEVYLDHAYAGTADHLKNIWLEPGAYDLSLAAAGHEAFRQRIYVLSGKSLKITAKLVAEPKPGEMKDKP
ncbi:MAG: PEGA domain-containing protein [Terriglobales bacterium]